MAAIGAIREAQPAALPAFVVVDSGTIRIWVTEDLLSGTMARVNAVTGALVVKVIWAKP